MSKAMLFVRTEGTTTSLRKAAQLYGVPRSTLGDKLRGSTPEGRQMGPDTILTASEESHLVE